MLKKSAILKPFLFKTKYFLALLLFLISVCGFSQEKYISTYRPVADSLSEAYGIPAAVILGVAFIESGAGTSRNSKLLNNHFGIVGKNNLLKTKGIKSRYKQFPTVASSYIAFCRLLASKKFYPKLKGNMDYKAWLEAMSKAKYSEAPLEWKKRITSVIKKYKLSEK